MNSLQLKEDPELQRRVHALLRELIASHDPRLEEIASVTNSAYKEAIMEKQNTTYIADRVCKAVFEHVEKNYFNLYGRLLRMD